MNKEEIIKDYIRQYNFNEDWSVKEIKNSLKNLLNEEPAIKVHYKKDVHLNEINREAKEVKVMNKISITFTDINDSIKTIEFKPNTPKKG